MRITFGTVPIFVSTKMGLSLLPCTLRMTIFVSLLAVVFSPGIFRLNCYCLAQSEGEAGDCPDFRGHRHGVLVGENGTVPFGRPAILWHNDYAQATSAAEGQKKLLFVYFCDPQGQCDCNRFKAETLDDPLVCAKLKDYVCLQVPLDASIIMDGKKVVLLEHEVFKEMLGRPGIAIVDFRSADPRLYGAVVSTFPITRSLWYTPEKMAVILDLPPGTLTQRTLIYAVRTHPDKPASTAGEPNQNLFGEAQSHSQYQADIRLQGHHFWEARFPRITAEVQALSAREVCAESWPDEDLVEAAVECVRCWRMSEGHWNAVREHQPLFGYDMKRGANGVWYATGIFGSR